MNLKRYALTTAVAALAVGGGGVASATAPETGPGNNGTFKAESHPGECAVTIDWYGMDTFAFSGVEFRLHGPSGDAVLLTDFTVLDADGGQGGDLDGTRTYDLNAAVYDAGVPPADEYQVKVTTNTAYAQGADTKYKVVWVSGCEAPEEEPPGQG